VVRSAVYLIEPRDRQKLVIPVSPLVIPVSPPRHSRLPPSSFPRRRESKRTFSSHRAQKRNASPSLHQTMDPRLREDDCGGEYVIPSHAGIHFDLFAIRP